MVSYRLVVTTELAIVKKNKKKNKKKKGSHDAKYKTTNRVDCNLVASFKDIYCILMAVNNKGGAIFVVVEKMYSADNQNV